MRDRYCRHGAESFLVKGMVGGSFRCPSNRPIHIKPLGEKVSCDSPRRVRMQAPQHVSGLIGATCQRCRHRYSRRLEREVSNGRE